MKELYARVQCFQEALKSLKSAGTSVFDNCKLEVSSQHPAKDIRSEQTVQEFILIQRYEIPEEVNGNASTMNSSSTHEENNHHTDDSLYVNSREDSTQDASCLLGQTLTNLSLENEALETASCYKPVSISHARLVCSLYNQCLQKSPQEMLPVCVLCDGQDPESTCLLEMSPVVQQDRAVGVRTTAVYSSGPVQAKSDLMTMDKLIKTVSSSNALKYTTAGFAEYNIMGKYYQNIAVQRQDQTMVKLDCHWEEVKNVLETPHGAKCIVHIQAVPGDLNSAADGIYTELKALQGFASGLASGEIQWMKGATKAATSIGEQLANLIEAVKQGEKKVKVEENEEEDGANSLGPKLVSERKDLDFTERLWVLIKDNSHCYDDIVSTIKRVFEELHSGQLQPMVHSSNSTTMAKHIRASYQNKMALSPKDVEGLEPLRMLVEMGMDKLKRDYLAFFIGKELTTLDRLQWYIAPTNGSDLRLEGLVQRLKNLHYVMELYVVGCTSLSLPPKTLWMLVRSGLSFYESGQSSEPHTFSVPVDRSAMLKFYSSFQPTVWRVNVKGGSSDNCVSTEYQLTTKRTFDHIRYRSQSNALDQTDVEGDNSFAMYETRSTTSYNSFLM